MATARRVARRLAATSKPTATRRQPPADRSRPVVAHLDRRPHSSALTNTSFRRAAIIQSGCNPQIRSGRGEPLAAPIDTDFEESNMTNTGRHLAAMSFAALGLV